MIDPIEIDAICEGIYPVIKDMIEGVVKDIAVDFVALSARLEKLEQRPSPFRYRGPFEPGCKYDVGDFVSHDGSAWHCNRATETKPGDGDGWTLAIKRGRDGKDMR